MPRWSLSMFGGVVLAVAYTASPLGVLFVLASVVLCVVAGRGLDAQDRRTLYVILGSALAARLAAVIALFLIGIPYHNDLAVGAMTGDQAYNLGRALRTRDILLGLGSTHYDYFVTTDEYGRTSYLGLLTFMQVVFGPAPYGLRLVNALLFTAGAAVLFRIARPAFGPLPAFGGLLAVLFLPSVFYASISLLKEALYFFATSVFLAALVHAIRSRRPFRMLMWVALGAASVWVLDDLRRGAVVLALAGAGCGVLILVVGGLRARRTVVAGLLAVITIAVITQPALQKQLLAGLSGVAKQHSGHVFTVGHAYRLLDAGFYMNPSTPAASTLSLTPPQAARFVLRSLVSFVLTPLPWEALSRSERAFLPEHLLWYLVVALSPFGIAAGWKRDPLVTSLLIGFVIPTAAAVAFTNGNVGTLLRLRGLVTPYVVWISVLGFCVVGDHLSAGRLPTWMRRSGRVNPEETLA